MGPGAGRHWSRLPGSSYCKSWSGTVRVCGAGRSRGDTAACGEGCTGMGGAGTWSG